MRHLRLAIVLCSLAYVAGCAGFDPGPPPLARAEIVQLSKAGEPPAAIVGRLRATQTVLWLSAADIAELRQSGVAGEVLDYLQASQVAETRQRARFDQLLYGPEQSPFSRCGGVSGRDGRFNGTFAPFC